MTIRDLHQKFLQCLQLVSTDTRKITPGSIFFALKGANFNGNTFAQEALKLGAAYCVVDEAQYATNSQCILVSDVLKTLQDLAHFHRNQFNIPVIGITGSNGKTTSKELIGSVLATSYSILVTEGNLNNHIGVPLTLLKLNTSHQLAVVEMGANKPGDIKELCDIAAPNYGVITNIGKAHIEGFGSIDGVIKTKTEMYQFAECSQWPIVY
jgi:UDP-N-acetylmuramoyl-tripeptide--D-alanyl-D-alanine ligase